MAPALTLGSKRGEAVGILRRGLALLTGAALLVGAAGDAGAYSMKKTTRGDLVHWEAPTVSFAVDPAIDRQVAGAARATESAMASWSGSMGAPDLAASPAEGDAPAAPGFDRQNGIFFVQGGYAPAGRALAITVLTYDNTSGEILDADVVFNGAYTFEVLAPTNAAPLESEVSTHPNVMTDSLSHAETPSDATRRTVYDLHHVVAHELGHTLGMNDEHERRDALMYRYSPPNDATIREPGVDDVEGLAELYAAKLDARGSGCANATVAPTRPSRAASHAAAIAALGLLLFLALRSRSDRRARFAFVVGAAAAAIGLLPTLEGGEARASEARTTVGHARARVLRATTAIERGLFQTTYELRTTECRAASCPSAGYGVAWGGTIGNVTQEVGGYYAPTGGDEVDVSFAALPDALGPVTRPLAGRASADVAKAAVRVLTRAD